MKKVKEEFVVGKNNIRYVDSSFISEFGNDDLVEGKVLSFNKLERTMYDTNIIKEFNVQECTLADVLETITKGPELFKDGNYNLFYIKDHPSHVVFVYWSKADREWVVDGWRRGSGWYAGERVFSPATGADLLSSEHLDSLALDLAMKVVKEAGYKIIKEIQYV